MWGNYLHPANINLKIGDTLVWSQSGQFTAHTSVSLSGKISKGPNVFTLTQDDFLGGQVLITFPYRNAINAMPWIPLLLLGD